MSAFIQTDKLARGASGRSVELNKVGGGTVRLRSTFVNRGDETSLGVEVETPTGTVHVSKRAIARRAHRGAVEVETP